MPICIFKAIEILELNASECDKKMPPDVKDSLTLAIKALKHIVLAHDGQIPEPPHHNQP